MKKILLLSITILLLLFGLSACKKNKSAEEEKETPPENTVFIYDNYYEPASLTVEPDTEITWVNKGSNSHTVTSGTPGAVLSLSKVQVEQFGSATLAPGASFKHRFQWEGNWDYYCTIHPTMRAIIKVQF